MSKIHYLIATFCLLTYSLSATADGYETYLTSARGFTEVTSTSGITDNANDYYILVPAETNELIVGVGRYEAKPGWASEESKALRYKSATTDPVLDLTNFFTIEKSGSFIGFRNVVYCADLFQTHDNAGYMYVNTYTDKNLDEWSHLTPTFQNGYWLFESGQYPISSNNWASGYLGPWNNVVAEGEPMALNRKNTADDAAGHYRLFRITKANLKTAAKQALCLTATDSNPANATWLITNPSFETGDETGWTLIGKDPEGNDEFKTRDYGMSSKDGLYLMNAWQWWAASLSVSQTVADIPSGLYELSGVVASWAERTITFTGNSSTTTTSGQGDATGVPISMNLSIGIDQKLTITVGSTTDWWSDGHTGEGTNWPQCFFKLDDVQLTCKGVFLNGFAQPLPNDNTTALEAGQWYYFDVNYSTEYRLLGNITDMVYSTDGEKLLANISTTTAARELTLPKGRVYFKTTRSDATLKVTPKREVTESTNSFTACALNVDGLPQQVLYVIDINPTGPGSDGTKKISTYLSNKAYDIMAFSEDFNYHSELTSQLPTSTYTWGTHRGKVTSLSNNTDGLEFACKNSKVIWANESYVAYESTASTDGNQYVKKGYRHYDVTFDGQTFDVYITHMDAGDNNDAITSRGKQWKQLTEAINASSSTRPKIVLGDTNCRWTRDAVKANFLDLLSSNFIASDVWVEFYRNGIYPTTDMSDLTDGSNPTNYSNYEIVDKIIYINPTAPNTLQLVPQSFRIEQDYTYEDGTTPLGDHKPVVVEFKYVKSGDILPLNIDLANNAADNSKKITDVSGLTATVTLSDRTLYKDNSWNTLCLPFDLTLEGSPLAGATIMELDATGATKVNGHDTGLDNSTLYLAFKEANSIEAGKPYLIKWGNGTNITNPEFSNVTISGDEAQSITFTGGAFKGYYDAFGITVDDTHIYYLTSDNTLTTTAKARTLKSCRAYFEIPSTSNVKQFVTNIGDEDGINSLASDLSPALEGDWYTLDGRKLNGQPTAKGLYIKKGRKVIVQQ